MNIENLNLLAQDFYEAHKDDLVNSGEQAIPLLYVKCMNYLVHGQEGDLPIESKNFLTLLDRHIRYQLKTRIEKVEDPLENGKSI